MNPPYKRPPFISYGHVSQHVFPATRVVPSSPGSGGGPALGEQLDAPVGHTIDQREFLGGRDVEGDASLVSAGVDMAADLDHVGLVV